MTNEPDSTNSSDAFRKPGMRDQISSFILIKGRYFLRKICFFLLKFLSLSDPCEPNERFTLGIEEILRTTKSKYLNDSERN